MTIDPSPFNAVKLSLGVVIAVGVLLILATSRLTTSTLTQLLLLSTYGGIAAFWLVRRTRRVLREQSQVQLSSQAKSSVNITNEKL